MSRRRRCRCYCKTEQRTVRSLFGQPGSQYDFSKLDIAQLKDRTRDLEEQQRGMKKKVNPKAMNMIDTYVLPSPGSHMGLHNTLTLVQRREARSEPEKDAGHSTEGQGKNRADHRGAGPVQARRPEDNVGEGQRVRMRTAVPNPEKLTIISRCAGTLAGSLRSCCRGTSPSCSRRTGRT